MTKNESNDVEPAIEAWRKKILCEGEYEGTEVPDVEGRITRLQQLWREPLNKSWLRGDDSSLWPAKGGALLRLRRNVTRLAGELRIEAEILGERFADVKCFTGSLVDGIDAFPLAVGNSVEADMLLLMRDDGGYRLLLTEVKVNNKSAWYAVVENIMQLKLLQTNALSRGIFRRRGVDSLPNEVPLAGLVLAPASYYYANGQKSAAIKPARMLIDALGVDIQLAIWDEVNRSISKLPV